MPYTHIYINKGFRQLGDYSGEGESCHTQSNYRFMSKLRLMLVKPWNIGVTDWSCHKKQPVFTAIVVILIPPDEL